jgi:uncharacterized membrane protein
MRLSSAVLWFHVLCGVSWIGAAASFVLATAALGAQNRELRDFAMRVSPRINRLCFVCAFLIPITGLANLVFAAQARDFRLPPEFVRIVAVKLVLFALMAGLLWQASQRVATVERASVEEAAPLIGRLARLYGMMLVLGGIALLMGLWLAGV